MDHRHDFDKDRAGDDDDDDNDDDDHNDHNGDDDDHNDEDDVAMKSTETEMVYTLARVHAHD